jgi:hypothetical protein
LHADCRDLLAGSDERSVEEAIGFVMGDQERLDPTPQLFVDRAFAIDDGGATGQGFLFEGRQEYGLDAARVERHGVVLAWDATFHAPFVASSVEKKQK